MRSVWPEYLKRDAKIDALVFVVDASDPERINAATVELRNCLKVLGQKESKPVLVLGCKFDVYRAYSAYQLCEKMHLRSLFAKHEQGLGGKRSLQLWCCQSVSNETGRGLAEAMEWIVWACGSQSAMEEECWFCRNQDVEEDALIECSACMHKHCPSCIRTSAGQRMCEFCFYCSRI
jgi:hypothetical protein